jgi:hypothetical protein
MLWLISSIQNQVLQLLKVLAAVFCLGVPLLNSSISNGATLSCATVFSSQRSTRLKADERFPQIPLYRENGAYMGYEFVESGPVFKDPNALREYINQNPGPRKSQIDFDFLGPNHGQIDFEVGREAIPESLDRPGLPLAQPTREEIFRTIRRYIPPEFASELIAYVDKILADAHQRGHRFHVFTFALRTEKYPHGFLNGHNHRHAGDLNYAKAEMGANTQIDSKNRFAPESIFEEDYISSHDRDTVAVFGDVWHRSPLRLPSEKHLLLLVELTPLQ